MLLLPVAALALLAFFFILLLMTVANTCEERERRRSGRPVERMFCGLNHNALTENARLVWATQLPALECLASGSARGISSASLRSPYVEMARRYPALYEGRRFEEWLQFLEESRVVSQRQGRLLLATHGHALLEQCRTACGHDSQRPQ